MTADGKGVPGLTWLGHGSRRQLSRVCGAIPRGLRCREKRGKVDCLDAYLQIAMEVLRFERRPLSPRAILAAAYKQGRVPPNLYGKTQHKTLQARLSEEIVLERVKSAFFRTAPGRFFLREFLADDTIPEDYRRPIPTRRRFRELVRGPALAVGKKDLESLTHENASIEVGTILRLLHSDRFRYEDPRQKNPDSVFFRSFVCVQRDSRLLSYRLGRYRDDRDAFASKRSIGFAAFVHDDDCTLFNFRTFGIVDAGVVATKIDLDVPEIPASSAQEPVRSQLSHFVWISQPSGTNDLLAVIRFECPSWFEPAKRRLALNDLKWIDCTHVNNVDDFDPWSKIVIMLQQGRDPGQSQHLGPSTTHHRRRERSLPEGPGRDVGPGSDQKCPPAAMQAVPTRMASQAEPPQANADVADRPDIYGPQ